MTQRVLRPNLVTIIAFVVLVLTGGANFVTASLSNQGLLALLWWGAAVRSGGVVAPWASRSCESCLSRRVEPWSGAVIYGVLGFAAFFVPAIGRYRSCRPAPPV